MPFRKNAPVTQSGLPSIPTIAEVSPRHADLLRRRDDLSRKRRALEVEVSGLRDRQFQRGPDGGKAERVGRLLGDEPLDVPDRPTRLQEALSEISDIDAATAELGQRITAEQRQASRLVCDSVRNEHTRRVRGVVDAIISVHEAQLKLRDLERQLESVGVVDHGGFLPSPSFSAQLGATNDTHGVLGWLLKDAADAGFIDRNSIPEGIRQ